MSLSTGNITSDVSETSGNTIGPENFIFELPYSECSDFWPKKPAMGSFFEDGITEEFHECVSVIMSLFIHF